MNVNDFVLYERKHGISASYGEHTDEEKGQE
jgi:hypothetical protein